nr:MAG TPA: hypothetical protein [Microviridae sp.]
MSVFWKNSNSKQDSRQTIEQSVDSTRISIHPNF